MESIFVLKDGIYYLVIKHNNKIVLLNYEYICEQAILSFFHTN